MTKSHGEMRNYSADQFELLEELGKGSFGIVYKALDKVTSRIVAIKQIDLESSDEDINEIQKEIAILSTCKFPQIIKYYGCFVDKYQLSIIMEVLQGGSCLDLLTSNKYFTEHQIAIVCREILKALSYLHSNNKIHRDIKAANILIDDHNGNVKVVDFGVATQLSNNLSKRNTFVGTPFWMSPEVILQHNYNCKTDIWSLGVTALELALGKPPYSNLHPLKVLFLIPKNPSPGLPSVSPFTKKNYSREFQSFIKLCLQKNPCLRPTAKQLLTHPFISHAGHNTELLECVDSKRKNDLRKILTRDDKQTFEINDSKKSQSIVSKTCLVLTKNNGSLVNAKSRVISFDFDNSDISNTAQKNVAGCLKQRRSMSGSLNKSNSKKTLHLKPISAQRKALGEFFNYNSDEEIGDSCNKYSIEEDKENRTQLLDNTKQMQESSLNMRERVSGKSIRTPNLGNDSINSLKSSSKNARSILHGSIPPSDSIVKHSVSTTNLVLLNKKISNLSPINAQRFVRDHSPVSASPVNFDSPSPCSSVFTPLSSASSNKTSTHESSLNTKSFTKVKHSTSQADRDSMRKSGGSSLRRSKTSNNLDLSLNRDQRLIRSPTSDFSSDYKCKNGTRISNKATHRRGNSVIQEVKNTEIIKGHQRGRSDITYISQIKSPISDNHRALNIANPKIECNLNDSKETNNEYLGKSVFEFELRESKLKQYKKNKNNLFSESSHTKYDKVDLKKNECFQNKRDSIEELLLSRWAESMAERWNDTITSIEENT